MVKCPRVSEMIRYAGLATFTVMAALSGVAKAEPAAAAPQIYVYEVEHSSYGNIGLYSNTVTQDGADIDVRTQLHVAVKMLGIRLFHQDASRLEHWENGRLISFHGNTDDNGKEIDIAGTAQGNSFIIQSPFGIVTAPGTVHPSNPWAPQCLANTDSMMSTKTGRLFKVTVTDTGEKSVTLDGQTMQLHQFFIDGEKHEVVWFDPRGVVVGFQTEEDGSHVTFVLKRDQAAAAAPAPLMQANNP
jgi:hypothetical protein